MTSANHNTKSTHDDGSRAARRRIRYAVVSRHDRLHSPRLPDRAKDSSTAMISSNFEPEAITARLHHVKEQGRTSDIEAAEGGSVSRSTASAGVEDSIWLCCLFLQKAELHAKPHQTKLVGVLASGKILDRFNTVEGAVRGGIEYAEVRLERPSFQAATPGSAFV
jgi:hypothetical protein